MTDRVDAPVTLAEYSAQWPLEYERVAGRIRSALGDRVLLLEHVGSTSVPGLVAKPVIDICLAVTDPADEQDYLPALERAGYVLRFREPDWFEHRELAALTWAHVQDYADAKSEVVADIAARAAPSEPPAARWDGA